VSITLSGVIDPNATGTISNTVTLFAPAEVTDPNIADNVATDTDTLPTAVAFALPTFQLSAFSPSAGGWSSNDTYPREVADVNGGGMADIIGFGSAGVFESLATGGGHFAMPTFELAAFGANAGGWSSNDTYPRALADVNGDTRADIIGFSSAGVFESLADAGGKFAKPTFELAAFGANAGGWSSDNTYPRTLADVNGDGMADIVGFSSAGVFESLATPGGHFAMPTFELAAFGTNAGGWSSNDTYPRALADVNGDHMADIVGFGADGVSVSLATGGGHFAAPTLELAAFGTNAGGWTSQDLYPRTLADVNGDGKADIVGDGADGIFVSLATGGGHFASPTFQLSAFGANAGGWNSDNTYPRQLADINGNGAADIVGFAANGVWTAPH
jgi:FG-GAP-like repeat